MTKKLKHEMITVGELFKKNMTNVVLQFVERRLPKFMIKDAKGNELGRTSTYGLTYVPEFVVIQSALEYPGYGPDCVYLNYTDQVTGGVHTLYMEKSYQIKMLTGKMSRDILAKEAEGMLKQLEHKLGHTFAIGSDPEVFVEGENGQVLPAFLFLKSKTDPNRDVSRYDGRASYWDGFQAEFETQPGTCLDGHAASVHHGLLTVLEAARKVDKKAKLSLKTVMTIPDDLLQNSKDEHVSLGCMPSLNVYGTKGIEAKPRELKTRSSGGHIHYGFTNVYGKLPQAKVDSIVKAMDMIIGVACVALFQNQDNAERRKYYGQAGEYRLPAHGLEYRTLSNAWLAHPLIMNIVFDVSRKALMFGYHDLNKHWKATEKEVVECINNCDVAKAQELLTRNKDIFQKILLAAYRDATDAQLDALFNIFYNGMEVAIPDVNDIERNWNLYQAKTSPIRRFREAKVILAKGQKVA